MMSRDDDQPVPERVPAWNAKTAAITPKRQRVVALQEPPTEPTVGDDKATPTAEPPARFELGDELGRGGMGSVHAAHDSVLGREVAIKQALTDDAQLLRLFEREAKITAQLEHPAIVPIHDAGRDEQGRPYYVMRRLEGEPLADRVARAPDVKARLALVTHVLAAVDAAAFAHARGVIHRDIKPWNILIGDYGETVLIDWGLARRLADEEADDAFASKAVGTPGYMAPEQVRGELLDTRADVYALGATLLHVLIGKSALDKTPTEWMQEAAAGPAPPTEKLDPEVPVELTAIVTKAMAPDAADRYADAIEMAADLRAFLAGKLVAAHRYTARERLVRFVRRHRVAVATATVALAAIAMIAVLAIDNVITERDRAQAAQEEAADRAELMLVERASTLAAHDPTRAVALLRTLPVSSRHLPRARDIATKAAANGIPHGLKPHHGPIVALAFSPDGRLLSTGHDGTLQIHDLTTGTSRTLVAHNRSLGSAVWADGGKTIVFAVEPEGLRAVDVASGAVRIIAPHARPTDVNVAAGDDRVRYIDPYEEAVFETTTRAEAPQRPLARGVRVAAFDGDRLLVTGNESVRLIDARGEHTLWNNKEARYGTYMDFAPDGRHAVVATLEHVIVWDLETLTETRRWKQQASVAFFAGNRLYASNRTRNGVLDTLAHDTMEVAAGNWSVVWLTRADTGIVALNQTGDVLFADGVRFHLFHHGGFGSRAIAARRGSPLVAFASRGGWIRWFDLRITVPRSFEVPSTMRMCGADRENIYMSSGLESHVLALPRRDGSPRTFQTHAYDCILGHGASKIALATAPGQWTIVDRKTGAPRIITTDAITVSQGSYFYVANSRDVRELADDNERSVWQAPANVRSLAARGNWLVAELVDRRLVRIERTTGRTVTFTVPSPIEHMAVAHDGTTWFTAGRELSRTDHAPKIGAPGPNMEGVVRVGTLPTNPDGLGVLRDGTPIAMWDGGLYRVDRGPLGIRFATLLEKMRAIGGERSAASVDGLGRSIVKYLDTGEEVTRDTRGAIGAILDDDFVALYIGGAKPRIEIYQDPVPQDPRQLHAWIASATNAVLQPGSDDLLWR